MATNLKPFHKYNANEANKREAILASYQLLIPSSSDYFCFGWFISTAVWQTK